MFNNSGQKGFTLIELLVVIAIIALLSAVVFATLTTSREKARIAKARSFAATTEQVASDELLGRWDFNEGSGSVARDGSGNGLNGVISGAPTWSSNTYSNEGLALVLNGSSDYITVPYDQKLAPTSALSFGGWFKTDDLVKPTKILSKTEGGGYSLAINNSISPNNLAGLVRVAGVFYTAAIPLSRVTPGKWHHAFVTYDGETVQLYYDGGLVDKNETPSGPVGYTYNTSFCIGEEPTVDLSCDGGELFAGSLDDIRVFGKTLTADQVKSIYAEGEAKLMALGK